MRIMFWLVLCLTACTDGTDSTKGGEDTDALNDARDRDRDGVPASVDCDDYDDDVYPGNTEICDGKDNNCNNRVDDADPTLSPTSGSEFFADVDEDGVGGALIGRSCEAPRGSSVTPGDCDDNDDERAPGLLEICDGKDNDCDNLTDDADPELDLVDATTWFADLDLDGFGDPGNQTRSCVQPPGTVRNGSDCDDGEPLARTGATEVCDGVDNDCDGLADDADADLDTSTGAQWFRDADLDGYGAAAGSRRACAQPSGFVAAAGDCDDSSNTVRPNATEVCDGVDNNCDPGRLVDDADPLVSYVGVPYVYADLDGDGFGNPAAGQQRCSPPAFTVSNADDCNDGEPLAWTGAPEVCDRVDNDCQNGTDEADPFVDLSTGRAYYTDGDGDGRGDPATRVEACTPPVGSVTNANDCNDRQPLAWTGAPEVCDGVDNDCQNGADDADAGLVPASATPFYRDADGDTYGDPAQVRRACLQPSGFVARAGDCDDGESRSWTNAPELCDGVDNDCDGLLDGLDALASNTGALYYADLDRDSYGDPARSTRACSQPPNTVTNTLDCNDAQPLAWTGNAEVCDGVDNNCLNGVDEADPALVASTATLWYADRDGDGRGDPQTGGLRCSPPASGSRNPDDCNDNQPLAWTGNAEVCDGVDNDCQNGADDSDPNVDLSGRPQVYRDLDGDGFGTGTPFRTCRTGPNLALVAGDCNDQSAVAFPGGEEVCDFVDNDCNGAVDGTDVWWDDRLPYRVLLDIEAPASTMTGAPVAVDVDLRAWLDEAGDPSAVQPGSVRVVLHECAAGLPEVPSEFIDGLAGVFEKVDSVDAGNDGYGTLAFVHDDDGVLSSRDLLAAGTTRTYGVYFGSAATTSAVPAPSYTTGLLASRNAAGVARLSNAYTTVVLDPAFGGLATGMGPTGLAELGAQSASVSGNGMYTAPQGGAAGSGEWLTALDGAGVNVALLHSGDLLSAVRSSGTVSGNYGSFRYVYTYFLFAGRPEVYVKVEMVTQSATTVGPFGSSWTGAVRPYEIDNLVYTASTAFDGEEGVVGPGNLWARGGYALATNDPFGVLLGHRVPTLRIGSAVASGLGARIAVVGQDVTATPSGAQVTLPAGTSVVAHSVVVVYPHGEDYDAVDADALGAVEGVGVSLGAVELR